MDFTFTWLVKSEGTLTLLPTLTGVPLRSYIYDHFFDDCTVPMVEWSGCSAISGATLVRIRLSAFDL